MGSRRAGTRSYERRGPVREPYDTVLVVCEGEKTEPNYFRALRADHRLSSANIEVVHAPGTDPMTIVGFAEGKLREYERVFCVFDRNGNQNFERAVAQVTASESGRAGRWRAITSIPCFEVWILLHFEDTRAPFAAAGGRSACDNVVRALMRHLPNYAKGDRTVYDQTESKLDVALANARRLQTHNADTASPNPATLVHELVDYLRNLRAG